MRIDKCTAAMLETVFSMYEDEKYAIENIPVLSMMTTPLEALEKKAQVFAAKLEKAMPDQCEIGMILCENPVGGGSLPGEMLKSYAVTLGTKDKNAMELTANLRSLPMPIIGRLSEAQLIFDMRTMAEEEFDIAVEGICRVWNM